MESKKPAVTGIPRDNKKLQRLEPFKETGTGEFLTTDQGLIVNGDTNSLKAGERGPTLLEDFIFREKMFHFDHERIPERIVHARGSAAHGYFQVYESMAKYTKAGFLQDPTVKTPVFARFSTVAGSRGSTDRSLPSIASGSGKRKIRCLPEIELGPGVASCIEKPGAHLEQPGFLLISSSPVLLVTGATHCVTSASRHFNLCQPALNRRLNRNESS